MNFTLKLLYAASGAVLGLIAHEFFNKSTTADNKIVDIEKNKAQTEKTIDNVDDEEKENDTKDDA